MRSLVVRDAVMHDGSGGPPVPAATLIATDGRISFAGPGSPAIPAGAEVIEAEGRHLVPGLIDAHVHLSLGAGPDFMAEGSVPEEVAVERAVANCARTLRAGVTTVRDLGGVGRACLRVASLRREGEIAGPRILTSGSVLTVRGGHAHVIGIEADTPAELVDAIASLADDGADVVKIVATGGVLTKGVDASSPTYPQDAIRVAVEAAHARGMRVSAHAIGDRGIDAALRAGADSVEHGCYLTEEAISRLCAGAQWLVPTLSAPHNVLRGGDEVPDYARAKSIEVGEHHRASFRRAAEAGARIAAGTDAGTPFNPHGGLAGELALNHENGLPLARVLIAATREGARLLGLDDAGMLREGFVADAVLLDDDPLRSVDAYRSVSLVVQDGAVVSFPG